MKHLFLILTFSFFAFGNQYISIFNSNQNKITDIPYLKQDLKIVDFDGLEQYLATKDKSKTYVINFWATWCAPCQVIESTVKKYFSEMPNNVQCYALDVDDNFELYGQLRKKKVVKGIPALLAYNDENSDGYPDDFYSGSSIESVEMFFQRCQDWASKL